MKKVVIIIEVGVLLLVLAMILMAHAPQPIPIAPAFVQAANSGGFTTVSTLNCTLNSVAAGDLLVAFVKFTDAAVTATVSDGVSYTKAIGPIRDSNSSRTLYMFYKENSGSGNKTITATFSAGATAANVICAEFSGIATSGSLDQTASSTGPSGGGTALSTPNVTPTQASEIVVSNGTAGGQNLTTGSGYTVGTNMGPGSTLAQVAEYQVINSTSALNATFTAGSTSNWVELIATFKAPASVTTVPRRSTGWIL